VGTGLKGFLVEHLKATFLVPILQGCDPLFSSSSFAPPPSSSDEEEIEIEFCHRRETDTASIHDFTGLPNGIKQSTAPNISPESPPFTIFCFSSGRVL